jgi:spore coat polysaccharide biosynthesis protein SpsF (cytidylyltransferase family)
MTHAVIVICTRPDSRRLPGKAFAEIVGIPAIEHILLRVDHSFPVILAVPEKCRDYDHFAIKYHAGIYNGQDENPLGRMVEAVQRLYGRNLPRYVVRITHDDLLIDREELIAMVDHTAQTGAGYGYSEGIIDGAGAECISWENLEAANERAETSIEHISYFVKGLPPNSLVAAHKPRPEICRPYSLTLDYPEDLLALRLTLGKVGALVPVEEVCDFLDLHPQIMQINKRPFLTVYTCAKDAAPFVEQAIESVLMNPFQDMEYVFVDDGSTDNTALLAAKFAHRSLRPFRLFLNERNRGLASSSNRAVSESRGKYVLRLDADDVLLPSALSKLVGLAETLDADIVYPDCRRMNQDGSIIYERAEENHHAGGALMRRQFVNALWFREGLKWWDGLELHKRAKENGMIAYLNEPAFIYRRHNGNLTGGDQVDRQQAAYDLGLTTSAALL